MYPPTYSYWYFTCLSLLNTSSLCYFLFLFVVQYIYFYQLLSVQYLLAQKLKQYSIYTVVLIYTAELTRRVLLYGE
jgi:hypothetical protein